MPTVKKGKKKTTRKKVKRWREVPTTALVPDDGEAANEDPVTEVEEPEVTPEDEDIDEVMQQLPQEAKIELWIWDGKADDWGYITRYPAHGFSIDTVSKEYGPGKYRMIIRGPIEGRMRIRGRKMFVIGGPPLTSSGGARQPDVLSSGLVDLVRLQSEMMRANLSKPQESMADVVKIVAEMMRPPDRPAVDPFKQAIEIVQLLKEGSGEKATGIKEIMEVLEMGMELGSSAGEGDGLTVFGKSLAKLLDKMDMTGKPPSVETPASAEPVQIPAQSEAARGLQEFFQVANAVLSRAAARNADLDFYAEWVADNVPDTLDPYFAEWFGDPGYPDVMLTVFPGVAPDWLRPLLLKVRALLTEGETEVEGESSANSPTGESAPGQDDIPAAPDGGRGDIPDAPGNDKVRK